MGISVQIGAIMRRAPYERYKREDVKVAGVTFCNDETDGGESRQNLLSRIMGEPSLVRLEPCPFLREDTGKYEASIKVRSLKLNKIIGYIPKSRIKDFKNRTSMVIQVTCYKKTYGAILTCPEQPSSKQYGLVKAMTRKGQMQKAPALYDKTAYQWALSQCMEAH